MTKKEIIEKMAVEIEREFNDGTVTFADGVALKLVKALFNLCYPCRACGGSGKTYKNKHFKAYTVAVFFGWNRDEHLEDCPTCNGTGKLLDKDGKPVKMIAVPDEKSDEEPCQVIKVPKRFIPEKAQLIEAYKTDKAFIILGEPDDVNEHNCDQMGCSTVSHVIYRLPICKAIMPEEEKL